MHALSALACVALLTVSVPTHAAVDAALEPNTRVWPHPVPARVLDAAQSARQPVLVLTLGNVTTPLANAVFDPALDQLRTSDGKVVDHYFRDQLGVRDYSPIDKSRFPLPPTGWSSWYNYYTELTSDDMVENAQWMHDHFAGYGLTYIQLDDAWQGVGRGLGSNRDWTTIDVRFRELGMAGLATKIRSLGFEPGIWIAPFGQSNPQVLAQNDVFVKDRSGKPLSEGWVGDFVVDPTATGSADYLRNLMATLKGWGYSYFKTDGFPPTIDFLQANLANLRTPPKFAPGGERVAAEELFRSALPAMREAIGPESYWIGCWGISLPALGYVNGARTEGDVKTSYEGYRRAVGAIQGWAFLHNIGWYCDPDAVLVRPPLSDGVARGWATAMGISGQSLFASDRMRDLPESRVELLRRIFPTTDIRALDLNKVSAATRSIWDLKIAHPQPVGRNYDVVAVFNLDQFKAESRLVSWAELGLDPAQPHHVYDFWGKAYLGAWERGVFIDVPPGDVRLLSIVPMLDKPQVISTSRHVTQGWLDLKSLSDSSTDGLHTIQGTSSVIANDPYTLVFGTPRAGPALVLEGFEATYQDDQGEPAGSALCSFTSSRGTASATVRPDRMGLINWRARFRTAPPERTYSVIAEGSVTAEQTGLDQFTLHFGIQWQPTAGYMIELDGKPLGVSLANWVQLRDLEQGRKYALGQRPVWRDGTIAPKPAIGELVVTVPDHLFLSELTPVVAEQSWGRLAMDKTVEGRGLLLGGRAFARGLGTHADSTIVFELPRGYSTLSAVVGVDDEVPLDKATGAFRFEVLADGVSLWSSTPLKRGDPGLKVNVPINNARRLELRVRSGLSGPDWGHTNWFDARIDRAEAPAGQ